jgi:hypothetical protein
VSAQTFARLVGRQNFGGDRNGRGFNGYQLVPWSPSSGSSQQTAIDQLNEHCVSQRSNAVALQAAVDSLTHEVEALRLQNAIIQKEKVQLQLDAQKKDRQLQAIIECVNTVTSD